jgi:hypothetical protein
LIPREDSSLIHQPYFSGYSFLVDIITLRSYSL